MHSFLRNTKIMITILIEILFWKLKNPDSIFFVNNIDRGRTHRRALNGNPIKTEHAEFMLNEKF